MNINVSNYTLFLEKIKYKLIFVKLIKVSYLKSQLLNRKTASHSSDKVGVPIIGGDEMRSGYAQYVQSIKPNGSSDGRAGGSRS